MKQGLLLLGCLVAAVGCKQAPPTQMETGYEVMTVSPTDRMISSAYSATIRGRQDIDIYPPSVECSCLPLRSMYPAWTSV